MSMKKFIFTLCIFCSSFLLCQGNLTEQIVLKFISERRWIELREYYDKNKNNITGYENLAAEAYIYTYTNQPAKAIDVTNQIITEFGESMGSNCIEWYGLNLNNYIEIQNYKKASDICDILFHLADKFELGDEMKAVFLYLKDEMNTFDLQPKTYLTNPSPEQDILLDLIADPKTEGLNFEVISNETKLKAIFDTGATECFINQQLASSIRVKYASHDTIMVNNKELKAKKGMIDSLKIGHITIYNVPVWVPVDSIVSCSFLNVPDLNENSKEKFENATHFMDSLGLILGISIMKMIDEFQFDFNQNKLLIPSQSSPITENINLITIADNQLLLKCKLESTNFIGWLDTGSNQDFYINYRYYEQSDKFSFHENQKEKFNMLMLQGIKQSWVFKPQNIYVEFNQLDFFSSQSIINTDAENDIIIANQHCDGMLGDIIIRKSDKITFNFRDMWIKFN